MNVLVTGCAGFIGSNVAKLLLEEGHRVLGIDNLHGGNDARLQKWRLDSLTANPGFTFKKLDISDLDSLKSTIRQEHKVNPITVIINFAARAGVGGSVEEPRAYYEANVLGCVNLLEMCKELDIGKFILASTSSVYGSEIKGPVSEDAQSSRPLSPYAASKIAAETLLYSYHHLYGIDASVLRYFTVYGPAGRPDMSIFRFVRGIVEGEPITVYGDGTQRRDFTYVTDVARGTVAALGLEGYETVNLGNESPVSINEVINIIQKRVDRKARIAFRERHRTDPLVTWADVTRAGMLLKWRPTIGVEEGIGRVVDWYMENREWARDLK